MEIRTYNKKFEQIEKIEVDNETPIVPRIKEVAIAINSLHGQTWWTPGNEENYLMIGKEVPAFKIVKQLIADLFGVKLKACYEIVIDERWN